MGGELSLQVPPFLSKQTTRSVFFFWICSKNRTISSSPRTARYPFPPLSPLKSSCFWTLNNVPRPHLPLHSFPNLKLAQFMSLYITKSIHSAHILPNRFHFLPLAYRKRLDNSQVVPLVWVESKSNRHVWEVKTPSDSYLHLVRADVELAEDVAEEVLDLVPGVDTVGAVQYDHNVHVCGAPCHV